MHKNGIPSGTDLPPLTSNTSPLQTIASTTKRFIGAVEDEWQMFSDCESDYTMGLPIGFGASSIVYAATYQPKTSASPAQKSQPTPCALKVLDLDALSPRSLALLQRETTLMSLSKHPNVLRVRGSWISGHKLHIALRLMNRGSAADIMRYGWPGGMEEDVARCILRQALQGLNYLHINGFIHRDVKAANLLIDDDGTVLLGDLGVAADLSEDTSHPKTSNTPILLSSSTMRPPGTGSNQSSLESREQLGPSKRVVLFDHTIPVFQRPKMGKRKSFVGTPCWMAPELIQGHQYDASADIWSFGITALELTQGRPPRSKETPQSVLLKTIQDAAPTLDRDGGTFKYSKAFKEVIDSCLAKDPSKRPTAERLLQTPFFKGSKKSSYLVNSILKDLPPLAQRQERRVLANPKNAHYLDSWNFTTLQSAHNTIHHRIRTPEYDAHSPRVPSGPAEPTVFEMEEEQNKTDISQRHSQITWAEEPADLGEVGALSETSSSPSDSERSGPLLDVTPSSPSSAVLSSPPSSVSATPPSPFELEVPQAKHAEEVHVPLTRNQPIDDDARSNPTIAVTRKPEPRVPINNEAASSLVATRKSVRSSASQQNLWQKIKVGVRRPGSSQGRYHKEESYEKKSKTSLTRRFSTPVKTRMELDAGKSLDLES